MKSSNIVSRHFVTQRVRGEPFPRIPVCIRGTYVESVSERRFFACYASLSGPNESSLPRVEEIHEIHYEILARSLEKAPPIKIT